MVNLINSGYNLSASNLNPENHISSSNKKLSFLDLLQEQFNKVNDMQLNSNENVKNFILDPKNMDINDVMYNLTKSQLSLYLTKSVVERTIRAYNDIMNIR